MGDLSWARWKCIVAACGLHSYQNPPSPSNLFILLFANSKSARKGVRLKKKKRGLQGPGEPGETHTHTHMHTRVHAHTHTHTCTDACRPMCFSLLKFLSEFVKGHRVSFLFVQ